MTDNTVRPAADLKKAIQQWGQRGSKWVKEGQTLALEVLAHIEAHGDVTVAATLFLSIPKGAKATAMAQFLVAFGKLRINDGDNAKEVPFLFDKSKSTDLSGAKETPWYEFQPDKPLVELFDVQAAAVAFLKRLRKQAAEAKTVEHGKLLDALAAVIEPPAIPKAENPAQDAQEGAQTGAGDDPLAGVAVGEALL